MAKFPHNTEYGTENMGTKDKGQGTWDMGHRTMDKGQWTTDTDKDNDSGTNANRDTDINKDTDQRTTDFSTDNGSCAQLWPLGLLERDP
jgi:hypothetical protein